MAQRKSPTKSTKSAKSTKPKAKSKTKRPARKATRKASPKTRSASTKTKAGGKKPRPGGQEVTIDRRRGERRGDSAGQSSAAAPKLERRKKVNRRRQIDPTTCERDYTGDEIEFMNAMDDYKRTSGRMFPTCSEVLEVIRSLGYVKLSPGELAAHSESPSAAPTTAARELAPDQ